MLLHNCKNIYLLDSSSHYDFSTAIVFATLSDNGTPGAAKSSNNKLQVFLYKTVYCECEYL